MDNTGSAATSHVDRGVEPETRYVYRIQALNEDGASPVSGHANADTPAAPVPGRPTGLTGQVRHDSVGLSWDDPGDGSITGYRILRRNRATDGHGVFHSILDDTGSAATSYTDNGVEPETRYVHRIRAINAHGLSAQSGYVNADTPEAPEERREQQQPEEALPDAPAGLRTAVTHDQVLLSWDDPEDESITGYRILRGPDAGSLTMLVDDTGRADRSHTDHDVEPETAYVYALQARSEHGDSPQSEIAQVVTPAAPDAPVTQPQMTVTTFVSNLGQEDDGGTGTIRPAFHIAQQEHHRGQCCRI